jgi:lipopolysaccharide biosynthesis protein
VAYYLPQFHPIPENDAWWGAGFTEWRNVARAFPNFEGHYQPRLPGELGYYDLRVPEVMARQVELARHHGLSAFCFHFYWFGGRTLLEMPVRQFLARKELDFGFSLCWANENWSRRWDGSEDQVLISQRHSPEDDEAFLRHVDAYFRDDRYLKIDGRPVLTVYRPSELPDARGTTERWRALARRLGWPDLYLIATSAFGFHQHRELGFDALSEFASFRVTAPNVEPEFETTGYRSPAGIRLYRDVVAAELRKAEIEGTVHPGLMLAWDNSARRPTRGNIVHGITVQDFRRWLGHCVARALRNPPQERLVFINAWNEWAEGTYLEPDRRFGYAFLSACAEVLRETASEARKSHDAAAAPSSKDEGSA